MTKSPLITFSFYFLVISIGLLTVGGVILMTDLGQLIALPRRWIVSYYEFSAFIIILTLILFTLLVYLNRIYAFWKSYLILLSGTGVLLGIFAANYMNLIIFPADQPNAEYVDIATANKLLSDNEVVYVIAIQGDAVAFPKQFLMVPHVAGATIGGEELVMTFCGLSNLPVAYEAKLDGNITDLKVLAQSSNNLILRDMVSGELIQQINGRREFGSEKIRTYPNQMMSWSTYKMLYPKGRVFHYTFSKLDRLIMAAFDDGLKKHFSPTEGPLFPTLNLDDNRIPAKEMVWGVNINGEQAAFTQEFFASHPVFNTEIGGIPIVASYDSSHDVVTFFKRNINGQTILVNDVDSYGNTSYGKLEKQVTFNGVLWMVWSHYFPQTQVYDK